MTVAAKILTYLNEHGISQTHVSQKTGIPLAKLNLTLNDKRRLTFPEYEAICYVLDVSVDSFLSPRPIITSERSA